MLFFANFGNTPNEMKNKATVGMRVAGPARVVRHYGSVDLPAAHETACQYVGLGSGVVCGPGVGEGGVLEFRPLG